MEITTSSPEQTQKLGEDFADSLKSGDIVALYGNLGSGKTVFTKGLAKGLGITQRVISPTFVFLKTYHTKGKTINHIDLYRSENVADLSELGLDEIFSDNSITIIEWADRLQGNLPKKRIDVYIEPTGDTSRKITIFPKIPNSPNVPNFDPLTEAAATLKNGGVVIFPTDTVYGIGCIYNNKRGLQKIYKIKKRPSTLPLPILVAGISQAESIVKMNKTAKNLAKKYWPGALTIVAQSRSGKEKIGIRLPDSKIVLSLIKICGSPIIGTSANFHGKKPVADFKSLDPKLKKLADYVLVGKCDKGIESTVVDASEDNLKLIRKGAVQLTI